MLFILCESKAHLIHVLTYALTTTIIGPHCLCWFVCDQIERYGVRPRHTMLGMGSFVWTYRRCIVIELDPVNPSCPFIRLFTLKTL